MSQIQQSATSLPIPGRTGFEMPGFEMLKACLDSTPNEIAVRIRSNENEILELQNQLEILDAKKTKLMSTLQAKKHRIVSLKRMRESLDEIDEEFHPEKKQKRLAEEAEINRVADEAEKKRLAEEAEKKRLANEAATKAFLERGESFYRKFTFGKS